MVLMITGKVEARRRSRLGHAIRSGDGLPGGSPPSAGWPHSSCGPASRPHWRCRDRAAERCRGARGGNHLAILPFENQGPAEDAYFADGIADEVRGKLARVNGITVIASSSASQYRGSAKIAAGNREGTRGRLSPGRQGALGRRGGWRAPGAGGAGAGGRSQTGATTWQQSFDTDVTDVFEVQSQIASRVAGALGAQLGAQEAAGTGGASHANVAAYDLYLKGKALTSSDVGTMRTAAGYFEQAVALDSTFVDAWAALSLALSRVYFNGSRDPRPRAPVRRRHGAGDRDQPRPPAGYLAAATYYGHRGAGSGGRPPRSYRALAAGAERRRGPWPWPPGRPQHGTHDAATAKLERARELDPRSSSTPWLPAAGVPLPAAIPRGDRRRSQAAMSCWRRTTST